MEPTKLKGGCLAVEWVPGRAPEQQVAFLLAPITFKVFKGVSSPMGSTRETGRRRLWKPTAIEPGIHIFF
ncbi:MAG: hypothetical protein ACREXY_24365, partial [Gammaproteobacteria bacterium]